MWQRNWSSLIRSWRSHLSTQLATLVVLTAVQSIVILFVMVYQNLTSIVDYWGDTAQITVFLKDDIQEGQADQLVGRIQAFEKFDGITYVSRAEAAEQFAKELHYYAPDLASDEGMSDPFPASFRLSLNKFTRESLGYTGIENLANEIQKWTEVDEVTYGKTWLKNYSSFVSIIGQSGWLLLFVLGFGSVLVIGNSIRAAVGQRRDEIEILELIGATPRMIREPFVFQGVVMSAVASILGCLMMWILFVVVRAQVVSKLSFFGLGSNIAFLEFSAFVGVVLLAVVLGGLGAYMSVWHINDGWAARGESNKA